MHWPSVGIGGACGIAATAAFFLLSAAEPSPAARPAAEARAAATATCPPCKHEENLRKLEALLAKQEEFDEQRRYLEEQLTLAKAMAETKHPDPDRVFGLTREELQRLAANCEVRMEQPGAMPSDLADELELTEAERDAYDEALAEVREQTEAARAEILQPLLGDRELESLTPAEQMQLLFASKTEGDEDLMRRMAEERAGMRAPPSADAEMSPYERRERLNASAGDRMAEALAKRLGESRTLEIREARSGWPGGKTWYEGCD